MKKKGTFRNRKGALFLILGAAVLLSLALVVACGGSAPTSTPAPPATPREPKGLEAKLTIVMGDFYFGSSEEARGGPFKVPAGKKVGLHIVNAGAIEHEIMLGRKVEGSHGYHESLFERVAADIFVYPAGKKVEVETEAQFEELELEPGADAWVRVTFPVEARGEWEIGCFIPGHYEAGMKATLIVE